MNVARLDFAPALQRVLTAVAGHPLLERLSFASIELAVLALLVFVAIRVGRIRSPRLAALLWLLVLGKPLVSLTVGTPFHLFRMEVPAAVVETPAMHDAAAPIDPPSSAATSSSLDVQSPLPGRMDEELAGIPITTLQHDTMPKPATSPVVSPAATPAPLAHASHRWNPVTWILGIWLIGVAFFASSSLVDRVRIWRLIRASRHPDPRLADRYLTIAAQMGLKRPAPLRVTDEMEGPGLIGSLVSTILIPGWLAEDADKAKLNWALRHELMHFRLRDPWAGLVRELSQMLFFFHPVAWWAGAKWKTATEKACDRAIVADEAAARDYAEQLYRILVGIHGRRQATLRTGLFATRTQIGQRIAALLYGPRTAPHLSALAIIVVALVTAVTLSVGGAFADKNTKRNEAEKTPAVATADKAAEPKPAPVAAPTPSKSKSAPAATPASDVTFTYAGTVLDDQGKPVAGAQISLDYLHASDSVEPVLPLAVTDSKGRFEFSRRKRDFADAGMWGPWWINAMIVATKPGYGPAGGQSIEFETTGRLVAQQHHPPGWHPKGWSNVLKLASDDVPIHGRILDTEGRPVAGVLVQAFNLWEGKEGSLDGWEAAALRPGAGLRQLEDKLRSINYSNGLTAPRPGLLPAVRTDANGSFTLQGLGRERLADLAVTARGIEAMVLHVRTRRGAVIKLPLTERDPKRGEETFYPCEFTRVAGPSVPVEGQVTDTKSQRPLAGIRVKAARISSSPFIDSLAARFISTTTDARGHYHLEGLPLGETRLGVVPPLGSPYLPAGVDVTTRMGRSPLVADVKLARGILVRGRVTDSRTGLPAQGSLQYFAFWTNPNVEKAPGFENSGFLFGPRAILHYRCDADGRFEIPVLPGRGILAYRADGLAQLPRGIGADRIDGPKERFGFTTAPSPCRPNAFHLLTAMNPGPDTESLTLDLSVRSAADKSRRDKSTAATPGKRNVADVILVHGRVLLPDGKPAVGAKVLAMRRYWSGRFRRIPLDKTTANPDGTFVVRISGAFAMIAAQADGFGSQWQQWRSSTETGKEVVLRLVADSPIHGRIVDLEGKPVRGVEVSVLWQDKPNLGMVDWLAAVKAGDHAFQEFGRGAELPACEDETQSPAITDNEGRFTTKGVGADRVVRLEVRSGTIAYAQVDVVTRAMQPLRHAYDPFSASGQLFGSEFTYQAAPTQPLVGTVRDAASGAPLAGVSIESRQLAGVPRAEVGALRTRTDAQGRYRLIGLQRVNGGGRDLENAIAVVPNDEQPYFMLRRVRVPEAPGLTPATLDFKLTRGLWITGRALDKETGKPVACSLMYAPFLSNPLAANLPEFERQGGNIVDLTRYMARANGTFRLVGLPGRGLVTAKSIGRSYRVGAGAQVDGMTKGGDYPTYLAFAIQGADVAEEINPAPGTESVTRDLLFERGRTVRLSLVDARGKPVERCHYIFSAFRGGMGLGWSKSATIEMTGMASHESRPLLIYEPNRHLGKVLVIHDGEKSSQALTVTLEPCATVKGRLVDADGVPVKNAAFSAWAQRGDGYSLNKPGGNLSDADGRFELRDLPPGCEFYSIHVTLNGKAMRFETIAEKVVVEAGKTIDLGEIKLNRHDSALSQAKTNAVRENLPAPKPKDVAEVKEVRGRVLLPDDKPAAGAKVFALRRFFTEQVKRSPLAKTTAGPNGEFTLQVPRIQPSDERYAGGGLAIVAEAKGFGTQWKMWGLRIDDSKEDGSKELVLKLMPEWPIHGRIVNLEGKPVGGVRVELAWQNTIDDEFESWLEVVKAGDTRFALGRPVLQLRRYDESQPPIVTDRDGRFTLTGIGADSLAGLEIRGDAAAYAAIDVVAHSMPPVTFKDRRGETSQLFGADFTFQAAPTRPIVGTVRDAASGAPLAGVSIESARLAGARRGNRGVVRTVTDVQGRYRLVGMPKGKGSGREEGNLIAVVPNEDQPYFPLDPVRVPENPGLAPLTLDFKLTRGLWITGRATDKATGMPVRCSLTYAPFLSNPFAADLPEFKNARGFTRDRARNMPQPDGTFHLLGLPGRGLVAGRALGGSYRVGAAASKIEGRTKNGRVPTFFAREIEDAGALQEINPAAGAQSVTCNLVFERGATVRLSLVDGAGKPAGPCVIEFSPDPGSIIQSHSLDSTFEMSGLAPNESRPILIKQGQGRIGKVFLFHYEERAPRTLTVTLEPCATVKGRLLDEDGVPVKHVRLRAVARGGAQFGFTAAQGECRSDGRFVLNDLPPGCEYYTIFANGLERKPRFTTVAEKVVVTAGKTIDLGEIKLKRDK